MGQDDPLEKERSCLENPTDRGAWRATVHGVTEVGQDLATDNKEARALHRPQRGGRVPPGLVPCTQSWSPLPASLSSHQPVCQCRDIRGPDSIPGSGRPLYGEMATHSSILAWKISRTEEPGGLQSMGWQRVGHTEVTDRHACQSSGNVWMRCSDRVKTEDSIVPGNSRTDCMFRRDRESQHLPLGKNRAREQVFIPWT